MNIEVRSVENITVITPLIKRLDASVAQRFKEEVSQHIDNGQSTILLNFERVDFIDSSCLGALVSLFKSLNGKGDLALCALNHNIQSMFKLTRMDRVFTIFSDQHQALQQMSTVV